MARLSSLLVPLLAFAIVFALCVSFYSWLWLVWFCWTHADRVYLFCSRRRGWDAFLRNNAIPALPRNVTAVWLESPNQLARVARATRIGGTVLAKPFLILVTPFGIKSTPLSHRLRGQLTQYGRKVCCADLLDHLSAPAPRLRRTAADSLVFVDFTSATVAALARAERP